MKFDKEDSAGFLINHLARLFAKELQQTRNALLVLDQPRSVHLAMAQSGLVVVDHVVQHSAEQAAMFCHQVIPEVRHWFGTEAHVSPGCFRVFIDGYFDCLITGDATKRVIVGELHREVSILQTLVHRRVFHADEKNWNVSQIY